MLKGEKVVLRPIEVEDLPLIVKWKNDRQITNMTSSYKPITLSQEELLYDLDQESTNTYRYIIDIDRDAIGYCGLTNIDWKSRRCEIFIRVSRKDKWGKGYGTDSIKLLLNFAFTDLNLNKIFLTAYEDNMEALTLYEALKFKKEGVLREHAFNQGIYKNMVIMGLIKSEWNEE